MDTAAGIIMHLHPSLLVEYFVLLLFPVLDNEAVALLFHVATGQPCLLAELEVSVFSTLIGPLG